MRSTLVRFDSVSETRKPCLFLWFSSVPLNQKKYPTLGYDHFLQFSSLIQGYTNPGRQVARATTFCTMAHTEYNLLHISLLASRILRWLLDFWKICTPLHSITYNTTSLTQYELLTVILNKPQKKPRPVDRLTYRKKIFY
jgi:hypothetical protein